MKKSGFDFISSKSGEKALELLKKKSVDFMLIDISLTEGLSGVEFMKRIKRWKKFKKVPMIAVTAHARKEQKERFLDEGFDDYIAKPFTLKYLKESLQQNLRNKLKN